ncbi:NACHT, LRR and PYD domains-containing protein 12-like [Sardina pilchardus]|uniref:NACHT, LRR and PYD domains-containing protein 12-like n=1 Tax=Sardina pilchardus TaxID=27697 RepID=UPI002E141C30
MCQIPVFCWILTRVHQENPTSMTQLFIHFLVAQTTRKDRRAGQNETNRYELLRRNKQHILGLSELAFKLLKEERILFSKQDLEDMDIVDSVIEDYSEMFTISKKDQTSCTEKFYRFVHQSVQEFLAALHVLCRFVSKTHKALEPFTAQAAEQLKGCQSDASRDKMPLHVLLNGMVDKALQCTNGHLDLFLRFLLGIALECNLKLLKGLLPQKNHISESAKATAAYIKELLSKDNNSVERCLNLLLCLLEMNDGSLHEKIEEYVRSGKFLKADQCSIQSYMLLTSKEVLDEFNLTVYRTSQEGRERLLVVLRSCRKAQLNGCGLGKDSCGVISANLQLQTARLRELDLSSNPLKDSGVELLSAGLKQKNGRLEKLRLAGCGLSGDSCRTLSSVLQSEHSQLRELDLSSNPLKDSGVELLSAGLKHTNCRLDTLRLADCELTRCACKALASVLQSDNSHLKNLDLTNNDVTDSGVEELCAALKHHSCALQVLRLSGCLISQTGCEFIVSALTSNPDSHLTELDLSYNHPGYAGLQMLFQLRRTVNINIDHISEGMLNGGMTKYACALTLDPNTACRYLLLSEGNRKATYVNDMQKYPERPERLGDDSYQVLSREPLTGRCYWEWEWSGVTAGAGVAYGSMDRKGDGSGLGSTNKSWSLMCIGDRYSVLHNGIAIDVPALHPGSRRLGVYVERDITTDFPAPASDSRRVGVYVDREVGTLSFYSVSSDALTHLHTFYSTFTDEPLHAALMAFSDGDSVALG